MLTNSPYGKSDGIKNVLNLLDNSRWEFDMDYDGENIVDGCFYFRNSDEGDILEYDAQTNDIWVDHNILIRCFDDLKILADTIARGAYYQGKYRKRVLKIIVLKCKIPDGTIIT